jgi:SunS family peptide S-glycosyltransferase
MLLLDLINLVEQELASSKFSEDLKLIKNTFGIENIEVEIEEFRLNKIVEQYEKELEPTVTCGILTYNEERSILRCIKSIENEFDEVIVLDSFSEDRTLEIIQRNFSDVKIKQSKWQDDFSFSRNKILDMVSSEFVFFMDADNYFHPSNKNKVKKIAKLVKYLNIVCVISPVIIEYNGHIYTDNRKMFSKDLNISFRGKVHEEPLFENGDVPINITADIVIHHDGYNPNLVDQEAKNTRNSLLSKKMIEKEPLNPKWHYFYARELSIKKQNIDEALLHLKMAIKIYENPRNNYLRYQEETLILICKILFNKGDFSQLNNYINKLETLNKNCIDIDYFRGLILFTDIRNRTKSIINSFKSSEKLNKYSYINSNNEHINLLMGQLFMYLDDWENVIASYQKVNSVHLKKEILSKFEKIIEISENFQEKELCI